jgi:hypothetical protein
MKLASKWIGQGILTLTLFSSLLTHAVVTIGLTPPSPPPPACVAPPAGIVAWWPGEGNGDDVISGYNAIMPSSGITFSNAEVGLGFVFDGSDVQMEVTNEPGLNFGPDQDFSIEVWILPLAAPGNSPPDEMSIVDKRNAPNAYNYYGYHLYLNQGQLYFQMADTAASVGGLIVQAGPDLRDGQFHHVAVTVERDSTNGGVLYVDGQPVLTFDPTTYTGSLSNTDFLHIGENTVAGYVTPFHGIMDELSLYNRALSPDEIQSIYNAGSFGKCSGPLPPNVITGPASQTVVEGSGASLSVTAGGTPPLSYQWLLDGKIIPGATNSILTLTNIHPDQSGFYQVEVANAFGTNVSPAAVSVTVLELLNYSYSGSEEVVTRGDEFSYNFSGQMFFLPATTNGTFVGWANIKGAKQYWVSPFSDYQVVNIPGRNGQSYTVMGRAGGGTDVNDYTHLWAYLHKGKNETLKIANRLDFSFPGVFTGSDTHLFPDSQTGDMVLQTAISTYTYSVNGTQTANNKGETMEDLVNALTHKLAAEGYKPQP